MVGKVGALVGEVKTIHYGSLFTVRDIDILYEEDSQFEEFLRLLQEYPDAELLEIRDEVLAAHIGGKLRVVPTQRVETIGDLRKVYTPGVANVVELLRQNPDSAKFYTWAGQTVAVITNGSRVLGLGNVGPLASLPVMEGKAMLMCQFVDLNAVPILIKTRDVQKFVETVMEIESGFAAIHLEDIETPHCFLIEEELRRRLEKPVMHDDQHGTAVAALAALISASKHVRLDPRMLKIGLLGLGAAGSAIGSLLMAYTQKEVYGFDVQEIAVERFRKKGGVPVKNPEELFLRVDVVISTTGVRNLIQPKWIREGHIIMALSNPYPEIDPETAKKHGAIFAVDGRSVNNLLGYPGIFRGAIDTQARGIHPRMLLSAAETIAEYPRGPEAGLLPSPLDRKFHWAVAKAVAKAAVECGMARYTPPDDYFLADSLQSFWSVERTGARIATTVIPSQATQPLS
jgi:malate dehydrogenase (oxaloacetate-decarboxylating)